MTTKEFTVRAVDAGGDIIYIAYPGRRKRLPEIDGQDAVGFVTAVDGDEAIRLAETRAPWVIFEINYERRHL